MTKQQIVVELMRLTSVDERLGDAVKTFRRESENDFIVVRDMVRALADHLGLDFKSEPERLVLVKKAKAEKKAD